MDISKEDRVGATQTLMQAFDRLAKGCSQLQELAELTEKLNDKLNRTEGLPKVDENESTKEAENNMNIVELFNFIAKKMEIHMNAIGTNTESAMSMID